jgi:uncharacterized protein YbaR (Trm112 family)
MDGHGPTDGKAAGLPGWLMPLLVCPECGGPVDGVAPGGGPETEALKCGACAVAYPVRGGIPRFVPDDDYYDSFGRQWNAFSRTQIDAFSGSTESWDRFARETGWDRASLADTVVLDAGCGAGRFADVALRLGARVVAVDASSAVDACRSNLRELGHDADRYAVIQASVYALPFRPRRFDHVYSIGVVQHTPDRPRTVASLATQLGAGQLALWVYERSWRSLIGYKYWFRLATTRLSRSATWALSTWLVRLCFPLAWSLSRVPRVGRLAVRLLPLAYDHPMTESELSRWLGAAGLEVLERRPTPGLALVARRG